LRTLVVSQYFAPEPGATSNRLGSFARGLAERGHEVTVVCEQPNHPAGVFQAGYGRRPVVREREDGITVHRLWVATSPTKTTARRLAFYATFAAGAGAAVAALARRHDVVFASSPPLPGVLTAATAARGARRPYVADVRDLWPAAAVALGELSNPRLLAAFERAERALYRRAAAVTATTRPFCAHIDAVAGLRRSIHLPNGALDALVALPDVPPPAHAPYTVGYAGNHGIAQGLGIVLDAAERLGDAARFVLVGDGPVKENLRRATQERGLGDRVTFRPGVRVEQIAAFLQDCDALLIPLSAHPMLGDFIPSKLYDAMAVGRPALVATRGEAAALTRETQAGLVVEPEDGAQLAAAVRQLMGDPDAAAAMAARGRLAARELARSKQVDRLDVLLRAVAAGDDPLQ
jgi:glycosyltransferase involved in cell wall biosynthesis